MQIVIIFLKSLKEYYKVLSYASLEEWKWGLYKL